MKAEACLTFGIAMATLGYMIGFLVCHFENKRNNKKTNYKGPGW